MRRHLLAVFACSLAIPCEAWAFQVTGTGTVGTVPVWTGTGSSIGSSTAIDGTASKNLFIAGPTPWIDFTAAGGMGDAQTNKTGSMTSTSASLTTTSGAAFASGDVGKIIGVGGAGLAAATSVGTAAVTFGSGGTLTCGATYWYEITYVKEHNNAGAFVSESPPATETSVAIPNTGCSGNDGIVTISGLTGILATGYRVYFAPTSGRETFQPLSGCSMTTTGGNACTKAATYTIDSAVLDGGLPPTASVLVSTIMTFTSGTAVTLAGC